VAAAVANRLKSVNFAGHPAELVTPSAIAINRGLTNIQPYG
jgi:hypothetical protein